MERSDRYPKSRPVTASGTRQRLARGRRTFPAPQRIRRAGAREQLSGVTEERRANRRRTMSCAVRESRKCGSAVRARNKASGGSLVGGEVNRKGAGSTVWSGDH